MSASASGRRGCEHRRGLRCKGCTWAPGWVDRGGGEEREWEEREGEEECGYACNSTKEERDSLKEDGREFVGTLDRG